MCQGINLGSPEEYNLPYFSCRSSVKWLICSLLKFIYSTLYSVRSTPLQN
jgi:hypothetical protein